MLPRLGQCLAVRRVDGAPSPSRHRGGLAAGRSRRYGTQRLGASPWQGACSSMRATPRKPGWSSSMEHDSKNSISKPRSRKPLKGNIYLAKVIRIEPSLQAAFVEYGGNRHGFLAFSEIHPDYYQIPVADRERLIAEQQRLAAEADEDHEPRRRGRVDRTDIEDARAQNRAEKVEEAAVPRGGRRGCARGGRRHSRPRGRARRDVRRGRTGRGRTRRRPAAGRRAGTGALVRAAGAARGNRQRAHRGPG